jgi:hypothetical protein
MQKKYASKIAKSASFKKSTCSRNILNNPLSTWMMLLFVFFGVSSSNLYGQVTITKPNLTINTCVFPSAYSVLGQIQIQESNNNDTANQGNGRTIILTAPANFEFNPGVGTITDRNRNVTNSTISVTATTITIAYDCNGTNQSDRWRINNIEIRAINTASTGDITRTSGNGTVNGLVNGTTLTNTLTSILTAPTANSGGATNVCIGANTPAFTNATGGGTWSIVNGTGSATVGAATGIVTGVTSGNVTVVYTVAGCSSNSALTVNPSPAAIGGGAATVCVGGTTPAFTNATVGGTWSITNGTGSATIAPTGIVTGVTAGTATVVYSIGTCSVTRAITINGVPATVTTPTPTNGATGVCYAGGGAVSSISWAAAAGATSYDVYFGAGSVPVTVTANVATNTYNTGALIASTTYYWRVVAKNACGNAITSATFSFTTAAAPCSLAYCASNATSTIDSMISNVTFNTINNTTSACASYTDFTGISTTVIKSSIYNLTIAKNDCDGGTNYTGRFAAWIDWNQNGTFEAGEQVLTDAVASVGPITIPVTIPIGALTGPTRMRCIFNESGAPTSCGTYNWGETEDYTIIVIDATPCTTPIAQPTAISLTPSGNSIAGSFTAASPASDSYLVVVSTSTTPPTAPVNGTTYTIGGTLAPGYTIVDTDSNTTFSATGLSTLTTYYFYIYSFNGLCTGGPLYLGAGPLTGNATTLTASYCTPSINATYQTSTTHHIRKVEFIGTLQDIVNTSSFPTTVPYGYEDYTGLAVKSIQAKGEGVNIYMESPSSGYIKAWVDWNSDGDFADVGETVYDAGGTSQASTTLGFIIPTGIPAGDYRVRLRISGRNISGVDAGFAWDSCTTNLAYYGETEDYILRVIENCNARISTITNGSVCGSGAVTLNVTGTLGTTEFRWYSAQTGGTLLASTPTGTWNTPSISTTTTYWVTAFDGSCETLVRSKITAMLKPVPTLSFATTNTEVCGENSIVALTATGDNEIIHLLDENFEGGMGTFSNVHYVSNATKNTETAWQIKTSAYVPAGSGATWYPAIQSNFGSNNFAFVTSDIGTCGASCYYTVDNGLVSNTVNSTGFLDLTFKFRAYYDRYYPDGNFLTDELMTVDVSINGGATWTSISGDITNDIGYGTRFTDYSYDLTAYINQANLKVRIRYYTSTWANGAAIDDIELYGSKPLSTALNWSGTPLPDVYTDAATTIPYVSDTPATTVYVKPLLSQLETGSYTFTATAVLTNGCAVSQDITILNKSSIWKGTVDNDWDNPNNWSPAVVPTASSCVIIPNAVNSSNIIGTNYDGYGKSLIIKNGGQLDIQSNNNLTITDGITVEATGTFNLENAASLIQVNNIANTGTISMKRNVNVRKLDYVYWSSPVANYALNNISTTMYRYKWIPTIGANTNGWGNWSLANENMVNGKGYIVRGPDSFTATPQNYTQNFVGVPNNGIINMPISRGTYDGANYSTGVSGTLATNNDDNWNLIGNPYPSAISANTFLATNTNIAGFIKFWTHSNLPSSLTSDPFYSDYVQNYTVSDYVTYNATGANPPVGNGNIGAGQGFFVLMNHSSAGTDENVVFDNTMRRNDYRNDLFFRNGNVANSNNEEKNRIWLNLVSPTSKSSSTLVGYLTSATDDLDRMFDAPALDVKTNFELYSFSNTDKLTIQGKSLPFNNEDQIPLGISISESGNHTIGISKVDGLFENENQNIYLEDLALGIIHNLRTSPYSFTATTGRFENRFILKFNNATLGNEDFIANSVIVYTNEDININASNKIIKSVKIHDLLGRLIGIFNNVNSNTFTTSKISKTQTTLLIEVTLDNGATETYKVIF